ncbi:hypothetical protein WA538_003128 [Blastocystis sp. DL]
MQDEYIDGEISRDISRTFPHHLLFRQKENGGQAILESVLRKISDDYFGLGYCQGMNYVVGAVIVALLDPELNGYYSDNDTDELQNRIASMDIMDVKSQTYEITSLLIDRLQLVRLWGYGFPDIPLYAFVLRRYLSISLPDVLAHFDSLGFDLSILVTRWFIPLFATALPFSALFRFYDYLFVVGLSALFRLSVALLSQFRQLVLASDLVQLSGLIHTLGTERLKREKDVQTLFRILRQLTDISPQSFSQLQTEFATRCRITMSETENKRREELSVDIEVILARIRKIHEEELFLRNDMRNNLLDRARFAAELGAMKEQRERGQEKAGIEGIWGSPRKGERVETAVRRRGVSELEEAIRQLDMRVQEGIQNLEDVNTKRLSLRIQLAQLMKERSLLLCNMSIEWCVC